MAKDVTAEARLAVIRTITDTLVDLADVDPADADFDDLEASMTDAADILCEALGLRIIGTDGGVIVAELRLDAPERAG